MRWFNHYGRRDVVTHERCVSGSATLDQLRVLVEDTKDWPGNVKVTDPSGVNEVRNLTVIWRHDNV